MAAPMIWGALSRVSSISRNNITQISGPLMLNKDVRFASKKAGSTSRNKRKQTPGKSRGPKKVDGQYVERGMIIFKQLGLKVYPGQNVCFGKDMTLVAMEPGRLIMSAERLCPYPNSPLYPAVKAGRVFYKKFYNIIPEPQEPRFKLISRT